MNRPEGNRNRNRNRWLLLLVFAMFAAPVAIALLMHAFGWRPAAMRNHGKLVQPPVDMGSAMVRLEHDAPWQWRNEEGAWTLAIQVPADCAAACWDKLALLPRMRLSLGRHAPRLRLLLLDRTPPAERRAGLSPMQFGAVQSLPAAATWPAPLSGPAAVLVHPQGLLVLRYPPGFEVRGVHRDFKRLIK